MRAMRLPLPDRKIAAISNCCPMMISRIAVSNASMIALHHMAGVGRPGLPCWRLFGVKGITGTYARAQTRHAAADISPGRKTKLILEVHLYPWNFSGVNCL